MTPILKLAEYKEGNFDQFHEVPNFGYYGVFIQIIAQKFSKDLIATEKFHKDVADPLKRFNGLFDGRTYGDGRFILITDDEDSIYETKAISNKGREILGYGMSRNGSITTRFEQPFADGFGEDFRMTTPKKVSNIHESPELWGKVR